jgi:hypothetical protein
MTKPILVNSYSRSGSVFFAEMLGRSTPPHGLKPLRASVVHIPELIGIKEVLSVTIFRDPVKAICSNIFKHVGVFGIPERMDSLIKAEQEHYIHYITKVKQSQSYSVDFNSLSADPIKEVKRFLSYYQMEGYKDPHLDDIDAVFKKHRYDNDLHNGHFPREVENDVQYNIVHTYIQDHNAVSEATALYLEMLKELSNE